MDNFEVDGCNFQLTPLRVDDSVRLYPVVFKILGPLFAQALASEDGVTDGKLDGILDGAADSLAQLPQLIEAFSKVGKFQNEQGAWAPLSTLRQQCFQRKPRRLIMWLVQCIKLEFGDFLGADGLTLLADQAESLSTSQSSSAGPSGG